MFDIRKIKNEHCEQFLDELEGLPAGNTTAHELLQRMNLESREHARRCAGCDEAVREVVEARVALRPLTVDKVEPGPWFASRLMATIAAKEREWEESNSVWMNVRKLAPRLVAVSALLLMLGGTWAFQSKNVDQSSGMQPAEGLFEASPAVPYNDDLMANAGEGRP